MTSPCPEPVLPPATEVGDAEILYTETCRPFVRTPDERFAHLPDFPYEPHYATVDGLRMHYVDEGPHDGEVVLLLHGQPTWSYLYRKMIPVLAGAGLRVIAPDMIGMGRSDKPVQISDYRYLQHVAWVEELLDVLALSNIAVFVQDWGSLIGLRVVGNQPDRFARVVVANGRLPILPEGVQPIPLPSSLEPDDDMVLPFADPALRDNPWPVNFAKWAAYALVGTRFRPSEVVAHGSVIDLTDDELAAYDVPFPSRIYMAGVRAFPSLINTVSEDPHRRARLHRSERGGILERGLHVGESAERPELELVVPVRRCFVAADGGRPRRGPRGSRTCTGCRRGRRSRSRLVPLEQLDAVAVGIVDERDRDRPAVEPLAAPSSTRSRPSTAF